MFKNYFHWDNFDWDLSRSRYQCEIHTQWENWAEGTPGHSDNSQGNRYTRQLWLGQTFIQGMVTYIYIGWNTGQIIWVGILSTVLLLLWGNKIILCIS